MSANGPLPLAQGSAAGFVQLRPGFQTGEWQPMIPPLLTVAGFENQLISLVAGPDQIQQLHLLSPVVASAEPPVVLPLPLAPFKLATTAQHDAGAASFACPERSVGGAELQFNFALSACTSPLIKLNEEPLTYLNQGQPYEVTMSCSASADIARNLRSEFRAGFYDRRLQFMEQEHLECWRQNRPGERVLDIDIPLSYNLRGIAASPACINAVEVLWQPGAPCAACMKLNCISTEFTTRKHGGEKGVPFRLQIDTFDQDSGDHLCSVAAQVKVFKPKGADRKHKMDFKKFERRTDAERSKYQPSAPVTLFRPTALTPPVSTAADSRSHRHNSTSSCGSLPSHCCALGKSSLGSALAQMAPAEPEMFSEQPQLQPAGSFSSGASTGSPLSAHSPPPHPPFPPSTTDASARPQPLSISPSTSPRQVADWLQRHRFQPELIGRLAGFGGTDLLRLNRADLAELCGRVEGIRLANCLTGRNRQRPRLLIYVSQESESVFHPVYLAQLSQAELCSKVFGLFQLDSDKISQVLLHGPGGIPVSITDECVGQMEFESRFCLHTSPDLRHPGRFQIFMQQIGEPNA
ncbi:hypothetical protein BOX15_Mlig001062g5 [Macrostomum lignano]|uniref:Grh/CP2 DB domain-containing protein n=2 Tax=Macrostomum lignano TaxID=282301 RepID=A0A267G9M8_9PLAT|nr:hypothetical protein BOX15_Mlig001062g5 [Macrostomum lignano]